MDRVTALEVSLRDSEDARRGLNDEVSRLTGMLAAEVKICPVNICPLDAQPVAATPAETARDRAVRHIRRALNPLMSGPFGAGPRADDFVAMATAELQSSELVTLAEILDKTQVYTGRGPAGIL